MYTFSQTVERNRGIALIAVLAVLTVLAALAVSFVLFVSLTRETSKAGIAKVQADMLAYSALEHAVSMLRQDVYEQPRWDDLSETWHAHFRPGRGLAEDTVDIDNLPQADGSSPDDARWIYVKNLEGIIVGRYAVLVEDEAAKINVNAATSLGSVKQSQGIDTFEIMLTDGQRRGLPITISMAKKILEYRYGKDKQPGQSLRDDNLSAARHVMDMIDNDADGIFDENNEGVDEPEENNAGQPLWDDRSFSSVDEVCDYSSERPLPAAARRLLRKYSTVHSNNRETFWDSQDRTWQKKVNLNVADRYQVHQVLRRANAEIPFEATAKGLRSLVANLIDYRDENHVLTTMGSAYGVESVCFNEIMATDASVVFQTGWDAGYAAVRYGSRLYTPTRRFHYTQDLPDSKIEQWPEVTKVQIKNDGIYQVSITAPKRDGSVAAAIPNEVFERLDLPWEPDFWKGGLATIKNNNNTYSFQITGSLGGNSRTLLLKPSGSASALTGNLNNARCKLTHTWEKSTRCRKPSAHMKWWFPTGHYSGHNEYYYRAYITQGGQDPAAPKNPEGANNYKTVIDELDLDGDTSIYTPTQRHRMKFVYDGGTAHRANKYGYIPILATSSPRCNSSGYLHANMHPFAFFSRPDIVELINVSDAPISLRNWKVVVNTGVEALTIDSITSGRHYSLERNGSYVDPNPVIKPGSYFYLTSNLEIFDRHYANGDGAYGSSAEEEVPVFELTEERWGITYPITGAGRSVGSVYDIRVDGADWEENIFKNEVAMIISDRDPNTYHAPDGLVITIAANNRNTVRKASGIETDQMGIQAGDRLMIFGLPRKGGFVSFTLKNQYNQITARTTAYGTVEEEEIGFSTEKADPTHYTWIKSSEPTIGGTHRKARNRVTYQARYAQPHIKNHPYTSIGELQNVHRGEDWENVGTKKGQKTTRTLKALSRYITVSGIRLDAEEKDAHISGWKPAFGTAGNSGVDIIDAADANWESGIWTGQKVIMLSGPLAGEEFVVTNSGRNGLLLDGYSTIKRVRHRVRAGDTFSVGPGYSTPMYYTRTSGEEGIWEWQNKKLDRMPYALYLFGLNDSIKTTEFLEENWNAELDVGVFNFATREFDMLPLADSDTLQHSFAKKKGSWKLQYDKSDGIYCGMIKPAHISPQGGIRLKLNARNLENTDCSGFAWFDYAYLAPGNTAGKININTAPERIISALKNITPDIARKVVLGLENNGRAVLKPYREESDILDVAGVTPDMYRDICNLITTRSDQFRVVAIAQTIEDCDGSGSFNRQNGDRILSQSAVDVVVDRSELTDGNPGTDMIHVIH